MPRKGGGDNTYWPKCQCGHAASSHGMTGKTADIRTCVRGGRYPCRSKKCGCQGVYLGRNRVASNGSVI